MSRPVIAGHLLEVMSTSNPVWAIGRVARVGHALPKGSLGPAVRYSAPHSYFRGGLPAGGLRLYISVNQSSKSVTWPPAVDGCRRCLAPFIMNLYVYSFLDLKMKETVGHSGRVPRSGRPC
jgi:hypothetical protein